MYWWSSLAACALAACSTAGSGNGEVFLDQLNGSGVVVSGSFAPGPAQPAAPPVYGCGEAAAAVAATATASAGTLSISGSARSLALKPDSHGVYFLYDQRPLYSGGEQLRVAASGGEVAAFSAGLVVPAAPRVTAPAAASQPLMLPLAAGLQVSWSAETADDVVVELSGNPVGGPEGIDYTRTLICRFPAPAGSATIAASSLVGFNAGGGDLFVYGESRAESAGAWQVSVAARNAALAADGTLYDRLLSFF